MKKDDIKKDIKDIIINAIEKSAEKAEVYLQLPPLEENANFVNLNNEELKSIEIELELPCITSKEFDLDFFEYDLHEYLSDGEFKRLNKMHDYMQENPPIYNGIPVFINVKSYAFHDNEKLSYKELIRKNELKDFLSFKMKLKYSKEPNIYNNEEAKEKFIELANNQRKFPESQMLKTQFLMGGGVVSNAIEHIGDLTHRMAQDTYIKNGDIEECIGDISPKINRMLDMLRNDYGFEKEFKENVENNYPFRQNDFKTKEDFENEVYKQLKIYAEEHSKLKVYNDAQYNAREAAVAIGRLDFKRTEECLQNLKDMIDDKSFVMTASIYDKHYENKIKSSKKNKVKF